MCIIPGHRSAAPLALALLTALAACSDSGTAPQPQAQPPMSAQIQAAALTCDPNSGITLPPRFCAVVVAKGVGAARHLVVRGNGDIYVALNGSTGGVLALRDTDGDGDADLQQKFGTTGGNGLALKDRNLFFGTDAAILRYVLPGTGNPGLLPASGPATIVSGLPVGGDHPRKTVVLDNSAGLFVNFGSATNSCQVQNRVDFSPGRQPCPELTTRAGIWRFSSTTLGQTPSTATRYASELRNMNALAIDPVNGQLYGVQNGRDQLFDNWSNLYNATDDALLPAEELVRINSGLIYGWPYCYYDAVKGRKVLAPEYGGDKTSPGRCTSRQNPVAAFPAHWAPLGMLFYTGTQFPAAYRGGLFVAFHGSRFDPSQQPAGPGYVVTFTPWASGQPTGPYQIFADGFAGGNPTPTGAAHRAVGLAQGPDGSLYITDDKAGWIWRIIYR